MNDTTNEATEPDEPLIPRLIETLLTDLERKDPESAARLRHELEKLAGKPEYYVDAYLHLTLTYADLMEFSFEARREYLKQLIAADEHDDKIAGDAAHARHAVGGDGTVRGSGSRRYRLIESIGGRACRHCGSELSGARDKLANECDLALVELRAERARFAARGDER